MVKNYILAAALLCTSTLSLWAGNGTINVLYLDGTSQTANMSEISKIEIAGENINIVAVDGTPYEHKVSDLDRIELTASDGVKSLKSQSIVVRTNGYIITAEGLEEGTLLEVYAQNGALMGATKANNGKATFDATRLASGVYIAKAGNQSLKMIKR